MKRFYVLGKGYKHSDIKKNYPFEIWLDLQEKEFPLVILEGEGRQGVGGNFKPSELLDKRWEGHIKITNTEWLIPICREALKNNDFLDCKLVIDSYIYNYGTVPYLKEIDN